MPAVGVDGRAVAAATASNGGTDLQANRFDSLPPTVCPALVPYGRCTEPTNVQAGGGACPVRFRCAGCDHFRTDVSYLPDLSAHLDDRARPVRRLRTGASHW